MKEEAVLVTGADSSAEDAKLGRVLSFFGVSWRSLTLPEFLAMAGAAESGQARYRLLCSGAVFSKLLDSFDASRFPSWGSSVHSVFVYGAIDCPDVLTVLAGHGSTVSVVHDHPISGTWNVTDEFPAFCGPLSGLDVAPPAGTTESGFVITGGSSEVMGIVSNGHAIGFARFNLHNIPIFVSAASKVIELDTVLTHANFEIRHHFMAAVPIVSYVKWAFAGSCWKIAGISGCVVIDDPLLRRRYGFLDFRALLSAMLRHGFSTNIAFIPWNWRRNASDVIRLCKQHSERYSLSIHGCDHTGGEFGTQDRQTVVRKASVALSRMERLRSLSGIPFDKVMVFPQGVFSKTAMAVLKQGNYIAAVNTEVVSSDKSCEIRISDVWDVALMSYSSFPIYTRRYPAQGVENFAFDMLVGKPCLVVIHHENCSGQLKALTEFIDRLNRLNCTISWRGLGDAVRCSYRFRESDDGTVDVEAYGGELDLTNTFGHRKRFKVRKKEQLPPADLKVRAGPKDIPWKAGEGFVHFDIDLNAGETRRIHLQFEEYPLDITQTESLKYRVKTAARRYLSEVRDNYVATGRYFVAEGRKRWLSR